MLSRAIRLAGILFCMLGAVHAAHALEVSASGSATYSIPIEVPPGVNGMQPGLALSYNSQGGNGLLGMGWGLSGLSAIERCPQTMIQDGVRGSINYDANDRFCLDGQRLVAVTGIYGADGTEYRTEIDSFSRIISHGVAGSGPAWFSVEAKGGQTLEYANTADSRIEAQGKTDVSVWAINKISDRNGNAITFSYTEDNANGAFHINRIDYANTASVRFVYETRTDVINGYTTGSKYSVSVRMKNVQTYVGTTLVRDYRLTYEYGASTMRSRLISTTECDGAVTCLSPTTFSWPVGDNTPTLPSYNTPAIPATIEGYYSSDSTPQYVQFGDFNGDGKTDYMWIPGNGDGRWLVAYSTGNGFTLPSYSAPAITSTIGGYDTRHSNSHYVQFGDFNGDGKTDYMWIPGNGDGRWLVAYSTGNGFTLPSYSAPAIPATIGGYDAHHSGPQYMRFGDFNGDGKTDYMWIPGNGDGRWLVAYSTGNGFTLPSYSAPAITSTIGGYDAYHSGPQYMQFGDFNGDGKTDYMWIPGNGDGRWLVAYYPTNQDIISSISKGLGGVTSVTYKPLTDSSVYTKGTGAAYPELDIQAALYVVSQVSSDDGIGGQHVTDYTYGGMKTDVSGYGNLGFAWMKSIEATTGIDIYTSFRQDYPYIGQVSVSEQKLSNGTLISRSEATMAQKSLNNGKTVFPYVSQVVSNSYEINDGTSTPIATATTSSTYDNFGNVLTSVEVTGSVTRTVTNTYNNDTFNWMLGVPVQVQEESVISGQTALGPRTVSFVSDSQGKLLQKTLEPNNPALKLVTDYTYDGFGNCLTTTVSGNGVTSRTATTTYDANGQFPLSTTNAKGHSESYTWDARFGVKTSLTGPNGLTTSWTHDGFGRKTGESRADGTSTTITYHLGETLANGTVNAAPYYVITQSTGLPASTVYYDTLGRGTRKVAVGFSGAQIYMDTEYDALGRVYRKSAPYASGGTPKWTTYGYDAIGRAITITEPDLSVTTTAYNGLSKTITNALGQTRIELRDVRGKLVQVTDSMNGTITYAHDAFGNLLSTTDNAGNVVSMTYNILGRKTGMVDPDMGTWGYGYNAFGELISQTNARNQTSTMVYDALGRRVSRTEPEGTSTWSYDVGTGAVGKISSEASPGGYAKTFSYDPYGRPSSTSTTINGTNFTMGMTYTAIGQVDTITYPTGFAVKRNYNAYGYLLSVNNAVSGAPYWTADVVDDEGRIVQETLGNGLSTIHQYNALTGRLEAIVSGPNADGSIQNLGFTYDSLGNLSSRSDYVMNWTESFTYDALNRITGVTGPANKTYAYDVIGNITNKSDVGAYTYADPAHVHAVTQAGANSYTYDADGNMLTGAGRTLTWTSFGKPASISTANAFTSTGYDANHKRISKTDTVSGAVTLYVDGSFEQVTQAGVTKFTHYIRGGSGVAAIVEQVATVTTTKYVLKDQLGSMNVITDATGAVLERLSYDAFGKPRNPDGTDAVGFPVSAQTTRGYTGHKMDAEVGLINMNARLYDPLLGRFISADVTIDAPQDMQTYNRYTYVINNPFAHTDPSGNWSWKNFWKTANDIVDVNPVKQFKKDWKRSHHVAHRKILPMLDKLPENRFVNRMLMKYEWIRVVTGFVMGGNMWTSAAYQAHMTRMYGGSDRQIWQAFAKGAITAWVTSEVNEYYDGGPRANNTKTPGITIKPQYSVERVFMTGLVGGASAELQGGSFSRGFVMGMGMSALSWFGHEAFNYLSRNETGSPDGYWATRERGHGPAGPNGFYDEGKGLTVDVATSQIGGPNKPSFFSQGSLIMAPLEPFPGFHAVSLVHDIMNLGSSSLGLHLIPSAIIATYSALADTVSVTTYMDGRFQQ